MVNHPRFCHINKQIKHTLGSLVSRSFLKMIHFLSKSIYILHSADLPRPCCRLSLIAFSGFLRMQIQRTRNPKEFALGGELGVCLGAFEGGRVRGRSRSWVVAFECLRSCLICACVLLCECVYSFCVSLRVFIYFTSCVHSRVHGYIKKMLSVYSSP